MTAEILKNKFELKELELNSLLEVTQAINSNLPETSLYKIYHFTLRANYNIKKMALYVLDDQWNCKANYGTESNFLLKPIDDIFLAVKEITPLSKLKHSGIFSEFSLVIPIIQESRTLAFVFIDETREQESESVNIKFIQALSNIIIVAIENKKLVRKELKQEALKKEIEIARNVQNYLFPKNLPYGERLKVEASYVPHHTVGGDYYDYIPINRNQFLICIADVSGKGVPAALLMSNFQASMRTLLRQTSNITTIIEELNYLILENARGENFITFFGGIYDHTLHTMVYVNAGHNPPLLIDKKGDMHKLEKGSTILGSFHPLPFINEGFITELDSFLFLGFTDGLTETLNEQGEEFGIERLEKFLLKNKDEDLKEVHRKIFFELDAFRGENSYNDDITLLSCKVNI